MLSHQQQEFDFEIEKGIAQNILPKIFHQITGKISHN